MNTQVIANGKSPFTLGDILAAYGIEKNPFPIDETDDFFFSTPTLGKSLDALRTLVEYGELLLVVSGVEGAGKTTFLNQLLLAAEKHWNCCRIEADSSMSINSMVEAMLSGFGVGTRSDDSMGDEALLRAHLTNLHRNGEITLLAVDDAHLLPQICTEFLLGLAEQPSEFELRLLLTTEPGRLGFSTADSKRVHVVVLEPFDVQQCADYLNTRLSHAGLVGDSPFSPSVADAIYQSSGGVPGAMHPPALHKLLAGSHSSAPRRRSPFGARSLVYVALVLAVGAGIALLLRPDVEPKDVAVDGSGTTGRVRGLITDTNVPSTGTRVVDSQATTGEPLSARSAGAIQSEADTDAVRSRPSTLVAADSDEGVKVTALDERRAATTEAIAVTSPSPVKGGLPAAIGEPVIALANNVTPEIAKSPDRGSLDWLRGQNPSHFVIQLIGTRDAKAARTYIDSQKLGDKGAWFVTTHQSKPWYIVVYGMYPDSASARAAIETLPERLRAGSPWPRSVASVVESVR